MQRRAWGNRPLILIWSTTIIALLFAVPIVAAEIAADAPITEPATIVARVQLPDQAPRSDVVLGGFSAAGDHGPVSLNVVWSEQSSGWLPVWSAKLVAPPGTLPAALKPTAGAGGEYVELYVTGRPNWGNTLETWFSYDPTSGDVSLWVEDITANHVLYKGQFAVNPLPRPVFVHEQLLDDQVPLALEKEVAVHGTFIPRSFEWDLEHPTAGRFTSSTSTKTVDRSLAGIGVRVAVAEAAAGTLRFFAEQGAQRQLLTEIALEDSGPHGFYPVSLANWHAGESTIVAEYVVDDGVLFTQRKPISAGQIAVRLEPDFKITTDDSGRYEAVGQMVVSADGPVPGFHVDLNYDVRVPGLTVPLHGQWMTRTGSLRILAAAVGTEPTVYAVKIPLGTLGGMAEDREVFVTVSGDIDTVAPVSANLPAGYVFGPRLAAFPPIGDYTVVRADLHSHTTLSDGNLSPEARAWESYMYGYDVLTMADHRTTDAYNIALPLAQDVGLVLIPGMETGRYEKEHLLVIDLDDDYEYRDEHNWASARNESRVYYKDQIEELIKHNAMIFLAHPGWPDIDYDHPQADVGWNDAVEWLIERGYLHGIEVRQYQPGPRDAAFQWAYDYGLTIIDVSDEHGDRKFDDPYGAALTLVLTEDTTRESVMEALCAGRTVAMRNSELRGKKQWLDLLLNGIIELQPEYDGDIQCIRLTNNSALPMRGTAAVEGMDGSERIFMTPFSNACLAWDGSGDVVDVTWSNIWSGPDTLLRSTFALP